MTKLETLPLTSALNAGAQVTIRKIATIDEYRQCEQLQARIWGQDDVVGVPTLVLLTAQENGGIVLGAFIHDTKMIGFVYSFVGLAPTGLLKQCSVVMGVDPAYQACGVGYHLKHAQRAAALTQGINYITWTFDPLISMNAYLNLHKLGAVSSTYLINVYGDAHGVNAGLDTDRLLVDWWLTDNSVADRSLTRSGSADTRYINEVKLHTRLDLPLNTHIDLELTDEALYIEIPENIQEMKRRDLSLATAWRLDLREIFIKYFAQGYKVCGFSRSAWAHGPHYLLKRGEAR